MKFLPATSAYIESYPRIWQKYLNVSRDSSWESTGTVPADILSAEPKLMPLVCRPRDHGSLKLIVPPREGYNQPLVFDGIRGLCHCMDVCFLWAGVLNQRTCSATYLVTYVSCGPRFPILGKVKTWGDSTVWIPMSVREETRLR